MPLRDHVTKPTAQIGFIKYVLLPLFEALNNVSLTVVRSLSKLVFQLYPEIEEIAVSNLRYALAYYDKKKEMDEKKKKLLTDPVTELEDEPLETA